VSTKKKELWSMNKFATFIYQILKADNQVLIGVGGETGRGKSTFLSQAFYEYGKVSGQGWGFENMTWSREELMKWIDGENRDDTPDPETGLRKGQKPQYSALMPDELIHMFLVDNRFDKEQQRAIMTLNMSRDRHLVIGGGVPNFWSLDSKSRDRFTMYVYIRRRGEAWVFVKEDNPFSKDLWNQRLNETSFRKNPNKPEKSPNYLCHVEFDDWEGDLREQYYAIRNEKRLKAISELEQKDDKKLPGSKKITVAFGNLINHLNVVEGQKLTEIAKICEVVTPECLGQYSQRAIQLYSRFKDK